jgi:hypothetical protein
MASEEAKVLPLVALAETARSSNFNIIRRHAAAYSGRGWDEIRPWALSCIAIRLASTSMQHSIHPARSPAPTFVQLTCSKPAPTSCFALIGTNNGPNSRAEVCMATNGRMQQPERGQHHGVVPWSVAGARTPPADAPAVQAQATTCCMHCQADEHQPQGSFQS